MNERLPRYGGQAVIEGVMMRGTNSLAIAMRAPTDEIVVHTESLSSLYKSNLIKIPFLRGVIGLWDALGLGMRALTVSANLQTDEDEQLEGPQLYISLGISLAFGIGLFFLLPALLGSLIQNWLPAEWAAWGSNLAEGIIRLSLLVGYIWLIGRIPDIKRVFSYHGAEHKTINAFEDGAALDVDTVSTYSVEHPRCGTSFLLTLVIFSVIFFSLLGPLPIGWRLISRVIMIPILAGIAYEYIRWTARHIESPVVQALIKPNLALQHLTTREPDRDMLEVSIAAFEAMYTKEESNKREELQIGL